MSEKNEQLMAIAAVYQQNVSLLATMRVAYDQARDDAGASATSLCSGFALIEDCSAELIHPHPLLCEESPGGVHMTMMKAPATELPEMVEPDDHTYNCYYCNKHAEEIRFRPTTMEQVLAHQAAMEALAREEGD